MVKGTHPYYTAANNDYTRLCFHPLIPLPFTPDDEWASLNRSVAALMAEFISVSYQFYGQKSVHMRPSFSKNNKRRKN
jgi:hypothetical protein